MVPVPEKVVKIGPKHCLAVLMGNNKNCTPKKCRYVSGTKSSNLGPVFNFSCSSGARTRKVVKTRSKHFSTVLTRNDKNCTSKSVGMFRVQNWVFRTRFSTWPTTVVSWKSPQNSAKTFFNCTDWKRYKLHHELGGYVSSAKLNHLGLAFHFTCSGGARAWKSRRNSTKTVFSNTDDRRLEL